MNLRPRLTYSNVVATLALVLALGGGTVYAAVKLGKNDVKSKNIAKGAVKTSDLAKNSVKSPKIKNGTIKADDIAAGVIPALDADVTGTATGGPQGGFTTTTPQDLALTGTTTFTPQEGEVAAIAAEAEFTYASANPPQFCQPAAQLLVNGQPTRVFLSPEADADTATAVTDIGRDADGPFGLIQPGTPLTITAQTRGDTDCTAGTQLNSIKVRIVQIK